jgi:anhydro-N-acetylmuramic acid kinase
VPAPWQILRRYGEKPERFVVGLMSGTSLDGIDAALVRISESGPATTAILESSLTQRLSPDLRTVLLRLSGGEGNAEVVSRANFRLGDELAAAVAAVLASADFAPRDLDAIASHGQTISHTAPAATLQIGEPTILALRFGVPVVSNFRAADIAAGGQGAPLVPYADWCLLTRPDRSRAIQNIGGIANVTYLPANGESSEVIGFDTGPGNLLIDLAAQTATGGIHSCDVDGHLAAAGLSRLGDPVAALPPELRNHRFLPLRPPKSAGREEFGPATYAALAAQMPEDPQIRVALFTTFTAWSIADAYRRYLPGRPGEVIIGGGGARNPTLLRILRKILAPLPVLVHEDVGINGDMKEAVAFALLANETLQGVPANMPSVTGARRSILLGNVTFP